MDIERFPEDFPTQLCLCFILTHETFLRHFACCRRSVIFIYFRFVLYPKHSTPYDPPAVRKPPRWMSKVVDNKTHSPSVDASRSVSVANMMHVSIEFSAGGKKIGPDDVSKTSSSPQIFLWFFGLCPLSSFTIRELYLLLRADGVIKTELRAMCSSSKPIFRVRRVHTSWLECMVLVFLSARSFACNVRGFADDWLIIWSKSPSWCPYGVFQFGHNILYELHFSFSRTWSTRNPRNVYSSSFMHHFSLILF